MNELRETESQDRKALRGAGGTPGGLWEFFVGFLLTVAGGYLLMNQVQVHSGYWRLWGYSGFGLTLIPLFIGMIALFVNGKSLAGWFLTIGGAVAIFAGILANLEIYFRPTSLYNTITMLVLLAAGIGLIFRSIRSHESPAEL